MTTAPLTFLFTDLENSTRLWEQSPDEMHPALARHFELLKEAVAINHGRLVKMTGDGLHAVFDSPTDSAAAVLAGQQAIRVETWPESTGTLKVRMGLHTGESRERDGDYYGPEVNLAARVMALANGGQILLSEITAGLVKKALPKDSSLMDLGRHRVKGVAAPERIFQLCHSALEIDFPPLKSLETYKHNLPRQLSSFIGREKELADVKRLLETTDLLTLLGPGGTGKTRLMLQTAEEVIEDYPDGVWLAEFAPLTDPDLIPNRVAGALKLQEQPGRSMIDTISDYLRRKRALLLLDNVEHILRESATFTEHLLQHCSKLKILVTGREALFIDGEITLQIPSLSLPNSTKNGMDIENLAAYEAVQFFIDRARTVRPDFSLVKKNATPIVEIVNRLDGIPLALELAAARMRMLTVDKIAERLNDRFRLLTGGRRTALPRQQTLQALIDWSWQLLEENERALLRRLSVFSGGWSLEAAEQICGFAPLDEFEVFDHLDQLINKSLVTVEYLDTGEPRYDLLESIRQFAQNHLFEAVEAVVLRDRHAEYFVSFTVEADDGLYKHDALVWIEKLRRELDNQRAVIAWTQNERLTLALRLLGHLRHNRGHWLSPREAESWMNAVIPEAHRIIEAGGTEIDPEDFIRALLAFAMNETVLGRNAQMREIADEAVALARLHQQDRLLAEAISVKGLAYTFGMTPDMILEMEETAQLCREKDYPNELAMNLMILGGLYFLSGKTKLGEQYLKEAGQIRSDLGSPLGLALSAEATAGVAWYTGDWETARGSTEEAIKMFELVGAPQNLAMARSRLGHILRHSGDAARADGIYRDTILSWQELGNISAVAHQLECFAFVAIAKENFEHAARLIGSAKAARIKLNAITENPMEIADMKQAIGQLAEAIGEAARDRLIEEGAQLSVDEAVDLALGVGVE